MSDETPKRPIDALDVLHGATQAFGACLKTILERDNPHATAFAGCLCGPPENGWSVHVLVYSAPNDPSHAEKMAACSRILCGEGSTASFVERKFRARP